MNRRTGNYTVGQARDIAEHIVAMRRAVIAGADAATMMVGLPVHPRLAAFATNALIEGHAQEYTAHGMMLMRHFGLKRETLWMKWFLRRYVDAWVLRNSTRYLEVMARIGGRP